MLVIFLLISKIKYILSTRIYYTTGEGFVFFFVFISMQKLSPRLCVALHWNFIRNDLNDDDVNTGVTNWIIILYLKNLVNFSLHFALIKWRTTNCGKKMRTWVSQLKKINYSQCTLRMISYSNEVWTGHILYEQKD